MKKLVLLAALFSCLTAHGAAPEASVAPPEKKEPSLSMLTTDEIKIYREGDIGTLGRVTGGVVGTVVGFGLGHLFIGKYGEQGWVYTVGELGSLVAISVGATAAIGDWVSGNKNGGGSTLLWVGIVGYYGFRIWEIVDVWVRPGSHNERYRAIKEKVDGAPSEKKISLFVTPTVTAQGGAGLGVGFQF